MSVRDKGAYFRFSHPKDSAILVASKQEPYMLILWRYILSKFKDEKKKELFYFMRLAK